MTKHRKPMKKVMSMLAVAMTMVVGAGSMGVSAFADTANKPYEGKYYTDYNTFEEAKKAAEELTREIAQEGDVLLKNKDNALPLSGREWVSVFGVTSDNLVGASDSAGAHVTGSTGSDSTVADALENAGFKVNPTLKKFYANDTSSIGKEITKFSGNVNDSFNLYNDVAFVVLSREGGEGSDASRVTTETISGEENTHKALLKKTVTEQPGPGGPGGTEGPGGAPAAQSAGDEYYKHYLMLTDSEEVLINQVKGKFKKVVVITNTSNAMEIQSLKDDDEIDGIVHIGRPGVGGLDGLADILIGKVSPSGGLVDEWMTDFTADPTWYNFGNNNQTAGYNGAAGSSAYLNSQGNKTGSGDVLYKTNAEGQYVDKDNNVLTLKNGKWVYTKDGKDVESERVVAGSAGTQYEGGEGYYGIDYEEGIYLGYKYYETVYTEIAEGNLNYDAAKKELTKNETSAGVSESSKTAAAAWWNDNVTYQYGYGLSYTTFSFNADKIYTDKALKNELGATVDAAKFNSSAGNAAQVDKLYVPVTVKNTGSVAGKKTVQVYVTAPYTVGGVEKSAVTLVGFAKSDVLKPGQSQVVTVELNVQDMASWDEKAANGDDTNGHFILDQGEYKLRVMENSHYDYATNLNDENDAYDEVKFTLNAKADLKIDDYSGNSLKNLFTTGDNDVTSGADVKVDDLNYGNVRTGDMMADGESGMTVISRADMVGTFPEAPTTADLTFKDNILQNWAFWDNYVVSNLGVDSNGNPQADATKTYYDRSSTTGTYDAQKNYVNDKTTDPWYKAKTDIPAGWTQAKGVYDEDHMVQNNRTELLFPMWVSEAEDCPVKYKDMYGVAWDEVVADTAADKAKFGETNVGKKKWDVFLNQITYDELCSVVEFGGYSTVDIASVGKVKTEDSDGPVNWDSSHCWTSADVVASTFNVELAEKQGRLIGNLGLLKDPESTQSGWYGPGTDIHRSPFSGRNNEYYSQDGLQAGYMTAAVVKGVQAKGIICYTKHCFMNDQESNRGNLFTWATEQSIRENNAKSFQMALQEGGSKGAMVGYGRLGGISNTNNYNMNTELYQNQWGTQACFVTDGYIGWRMRTSPDMMVRAGNVFELYTTPFVEYLSGEWDAEKGTVMLGETESYTQWYCVRMCAKSVLYQIAGTVGQRNGYSELTVSGGALAGGMQSVKYEASVSIKNLIDSDSTAVVSLKEGTKLPAGLELNSITGAISGTPLVAGDYTISINYIIDGFISKSADYTLKIDSALKLDADGDSLDALKVGEEFATRIISDEFNTDKYNKISYSVKSGNLPEGLTLNENGIIEGTPETAGVYNVVVEMTAEKESSSGGNKGDGNKRAVEPRGGGNKGESKPEITKVEIQLTFKVAGADGETPELPEEPVYLTEAQVKALIEANKGLTEAQVKELIAASASGNGLTEAQVNVLINKALAENEGGSGCNSSLSAGECLMTAAGLVTLAGAAVIAGKKMRKNNK